MYNGKLIGDLFDAVERAQNSGDRQRPRTENFPLPSGDSPAKQPAGSTPIQESATARIIPADAWFERG
jgi:hypothetical protein